MKRERSWLVVLAMAGAMVLGLSEDSSAIFDYDDGYSYTQPSAELVMPYDTLNNDLLPPSPARVTFLTVSNVSDRQVSTHWIFWSEDCAEVVNFSICLTPNDTVVVDPRDMGAMNAANERIGPDISLEDVRGVATVIAYETDDNCSPYSSTTPIAGESIVGSFTFADIDAGYSFGNDAFGLGTDSSGAVQVPEPDIGEDNFEFAIQTFDPTSVPNSLAVLTHLTEASDNTVRPAASGSLRFFTSFVDTVEIPTSLPDTTVRCTEFYTIDEDNPLIPAATTVETSGIIRLQPAAGLTPGEDYLYGIVGQAAGSLGASSSLKVEQVSSASPAFVDGMDSGLF